jgi:hypothetical protein
MSFLRLSALCILFGTFVACGDIKVETNGADTGVTDPTACTTDSDCSSSLACEVGTCNKSKGSCSYTVATGKCLIGDTCFNEGQTEPGVPCKVCLPELDQFTFLNKTCADGQDCDTSTGECVSDGSQTCGNSKLEGTETCDDGNANAGDGCSDACDTENGWECATVGDACADVDECAADTSPCDANATCTNTDGSFECACNAGWVASADGACADADECAADESPCAANEACTNTDGSFECACAAGYLAGDDGACSDVDECAADASPCDVNATCTNTDGAFECACNEGWVANDDGTCGDVDECAADASPCVANQDCTNTDGGFECACSAGYIADADGACGDVDECGDTATLSEDFNAVDDEGAAIAPEGWTMSWSDMLDINKEDAVSWHINAAGQLQYSNDAGTNYNGTTSGSAALPKMDINAGHMLHASVAVQVGNQNAADADKAQIGFLSCSTDGDYDACWLAHKEGLMDADGKAVATLVPLWNKNDYNTKIADANGFAGDMVDISLDLSAAAGWSGWLNFRFNSVNSDANEGSGFIVDNVSVTQVSQACGANQGCTNNDGGFECTCLDGYEADADGACADIDECADGLADCEENASCVNNVGDYACECNAGYVFDGDKSCVDVDECALDTDDCDVNAACTNNAGNFECACNAGYDGDGKACTDVDECLVDNGGCANICTNTPGSYACGCPEGYELAANGNGCDDIDECAAANGGCAQACTNSVGSFACGCGNGYKLNADGSTCDDVNECDFGNAGCAQTCTNTAGFFACGCDNGYVLNANGSDCDDINECNDNNGGCAQNCVNSVGSFTCTCNQGYTVNGASCDDINECTDNNGGCAQTCSNTNGSFNCGCNNGYTLNANGVGCDDINECKGVNNCSPDASCTNTPGSFSCACNKGYSGNGVECTKDVVACSPVKVYAADINVDTLLSCKGGNDGFNFLCNHAGHGKWTGNAPEGDFNGGKTCWAVGEADNNVNMSYPNCGAGCTHYEYVECEAKEGSYCPVGPQTNVNPGTVTNGGWTQCYSGPYNIDGDPAWFNACNGTDVMVACRQVGAKSINLLAWAPKADVMFDTGNNSDQLHVANGSGWYYNTGGKTSMGFVAAGDSVQKNNCDTASSGSNDKRLCWHFNAGGYRCGATTGLNGDAGWERILYTR